MKRFFPLFALLLTLTLQAHAAATAPGTYYVAANELNVRLAPQPGATIMKTLKRNQKVKVLEVKKGWAHISGYDDMPLWVAANFLTTHVPAPRSREKFPKDPRIRGLPVAGHDGATAKDVKFLYEIAQYLLQSGKCDRVEIAGRRHSRPGMYSLRCGDKNYYFQPSDMQQSGTGNRAAVK